MNIIMFKCRDKWLWTTKMLDNVAYYEKALAMKL